jgi:DNA-binding transcriptional ArsR family regulator
MNRAMAPTKAPTSPDDAAFQLHAELCKVLTDPKRLLLIDALRHAERSVGELAGQIGMSLPNASQHLSVLRHAGLVAARRQGTTVRYRLVEPRIGDACDIVHQIVADRRAGATRFDEEGPSEQ